MSPNGRVRLLSAALLGAALGLWTLMPPTGPRVLAFGAAPLALVVAFAAAEILVVTLTFDRETHTFSVSELPLVVGLYSATPGGLVLARIIGSAIALIRWRQQPLKLLFNLCHTALTTVIAVIVWHAVVRLGDPLGPAGWAGVLGGVLLADAVAAAIICVAMRLRTGRSEPGMLRQTLISGTVPAFVNASFGLIAVTVLSVDWRAGWMLTVFAALLVLAHRAHGTLRRRIEALSGLNDFTGSVAGHLAVDGVVDAVLVQLREQLRTDLAEIVLGDGAQRWSTGDEIDAAPSIAARIGRDADDPPLLLSRGTRDGRLRAVLQSAGLRDAMTVPLRGDDGLVGTVSVANRIGEVETFDDDDLQVLQALANHAAVALSNAALADRLRLQVTENEHQALHDALTGLPNRRLFTERLAAAPGPVAVLLLDLDGFKEVNDTLGHGTGDGLLQLVAQRLVDNLPGARCVARLGGDEFVVALDVTSGDQAVGLARRLRESLTAPFALADMALSVDASIGVAMSCADEDAAELLKQADIAMYAAKAARSGVEEYAAELNRSSPERLLLPSELREAIRSGSLTVHYQPKAALGTGDIVCVEALVRWNHPRRGLVPPSEFVPLAEQAGLIAPLTYYVLDAALDRCRRWHADGLDIGVAVNLSTRILHDQTLPTTLAAALDRAGLPATVLTFEITETDIMADPVRTIEVLRRLAAMGVKLSIDDLGTGYSSLAYLKRLPVHEVKIDRSFVMNMSADPEDEAIVEAIVALGHRLGKHVVAEGVEDAETYGRLQALGCDVAQGYWIARPMPGEDLATWLRTWARPATYSVAVV